MMKNLYCESRSLTNEASVEHYFVDRLLEDLGFDDSDIRPKTSLKDIKIGSGSRSSLYKPDYILLNKGIPVVVLDAKGPYEDLDAWTLQCSSYCLELNKRFDYNPVRYYVISNGLSTSLYQWDNDKSILSLAFEDFVAGNQKLKQLKTSLSKKSLARLIEDEKEESDQKLFAFDKIPLELLISSFQRIHQYIWKKEKKKPSSVFEELIKVVFVKIRKDRELHEKYGDFPQPAKRDVVCSVRWIDSQTESDNPVNDILFSRLKKELESEIIAKKKKRIFDADEQINLAPDTIRWVISELEHVDLFGMEEDVHGACLNLSLKLPREARS